MPLQLGALAAGKFYVGASPVSAVYLGSMLVYTAAGAFSPLQLFAAGEQGVWYDPSDFTTMFQDAAGTTPVTAVEQPVGLILDKSKGFVLGPELVTNGNFSNGTTNWTAINSSIANVSGELQVTNSGAVYGLGYQAITVAPNKWHKISITLRAGTASVVYVQVKESVPSGVSVFNQNTASKTNVTITGYFYATLSTYYVSCVNNNDSNATGFFDNISVKELPGNHATQSTATARPILKIDGNGKHYLLFDGVDDRFTINAPWFSGAQGHTSFGGISFGAGANGFVINSDLSPRTAQLFRIGSGVTNNLVFNTAVSVFATPGASVFPDTPLVLSQSTTTALLTSKLNKAVTGTAAITGTLQTTAGLLIIGGANCRVYSLIHVANVVANDQITQTENWVNTKTGAY